MAGNLSFEVDESTTSLQFRQKVGPEQFDAFAVKYAWMDGGKHVSHASPATVLLQYASDEPFLSEAIAKRYSDLVSEPKKLNIYKAPHALNADATRDRIAFLAAELSFKPPDAKAIVLLPALNQPSWLKSN